MKVHVINCATFQPLGLVELQSLASQYQELLPANALLDRAKIALSPVLSVLEKTMKNFIVPTRCLVLELSSDELILVDAGFSAVDINNSSSQKNISWKVLEYLGRPKLLLEETAYAQIEKLGLNPKNVKHIILSHLDIDHVSGVKDFPWATVHVSYDELSAAKNPQSVLEKERYSHLSNYQTENWKSHLFKGDYWLGLESISKIKDLPECIHLIPLYGHTRGHCGVAIDNPHGGKLLFCADAFFMNKEIETTFYTNPLLKLYNLISPSDRSNLVLSKLKLRNFYRFHKSTVKFISSHSL
jgi:glyoxylase-like metal-dependent hydrolase (beta-lactamase superfamily II)